MHDHLLCAVYQGKHSSTCSHLFLVCYLFVWLALAYDLVWHAGLNYLGNSSLVHAQSIIATLAVQVEFLRQTHESSWPLL